MLVSREGLTSSRSVAISWVTRAPLETKYEVQANPASSASADNAADRTGMESSSKVGGTGTFADAVLLELATGLPASESLASVDTASPAGLSMGCVDSPGNEATSSAREASEEYGEMEEGWVRRCTRSSGVIARICAVLYEI